MRCGPKEGCLAATNLAMSLTDLGTRLKMMGDVNAAVHYYNSALQHDPRYAPTYFNLGVVFSEVCVHVCVGVLLGVWVGVVGVVHVGARDVVATHKRAHARAHTQKPHARSRSRART